MEKMINKRRAGDENIGKLIVFAITIVIAIGLVGLVSYFYTQSRQVAVNTSILGDVNSTSADIAKVPGFEATTDCTVAYDAITNVYTMSGAAACATAAAATKGVKMVNAAAGTYQIAK